MESTRKVSESRGYHNRASRGCTLSLGSRGENSVPRVGRNETTHHIPMWPLVHAFKHILPLIPHILSTATYHTRFVRSSSPETGVIAYELSMAKHKDIKALAMHTCQT